MTGPKSTGYSVILLSVFVLMCTEGVTLGSAQTGTLPDIKKDCTICHTSHDMKQGTVLLKKPVSELCIGCHPDRKAPNEHKVDIVPAMKVDRLPLADGKITCMTCHDPHSNKYGSLLRVPRKNLCQTCHPV